MRFTGNIDESTDNLQYIDDKKDPIWVEKTIFLKQLVEGNRNLFVYNDPKVRKFFFSDRNTPITQFIYKRYLPNEDQMEVYTNNEFRMQIAKSFSIPSTDKKLQNLPYKESSLIAIFKKHNAMDDSGLKSDNAKSSLNLFVKPGISFSSAKLKVDDGSASNVNFANKAGFRFGIELEYVLPSRKNKWALFVEPIYQNYKQTGENFYNNPAEINYNAIVLSLGFRHYFFVDTDSRIFLEGLTNIVELRMGDNFIHYGIPGTFAEHILETKSGITFGGGIGFSYKNKYLISAQYVAKNLGSNYNFLNIPYNQLSVIAAYNIF